MRFDLTDLRVFLFACESGSMTAAATRAHLTLAAVSARIRAMEESAGTPLLERRARGVTATPAGEALARHARVVMHQLEELRQDVAGHTGGESARTVLLANSSAMARPIHGIIADVLDAHPGARLVARECESEATVHALRTGDADVGIVSSAVDTEGLVTAQLGPDPLVVIVASTHPLASRATVSFADAIAFDWIGWGDGRALHTHLAMRAQRAGGVLKTTASVPSAEGVIELVARGQGVSVLPREMLRHHVTPGQLRVLALDDAWAGRTLLVCRTPGNTSPLPLALHQAFASHWP
ncbi:MAG: LysR family transcriptional regulator [Pseudomonadota bacterium]